MAKNPPPPGRPVFIWGAGELGRQVRRLCASGALEPQGFIDGTEERAGQDLDGLRVCAPDELPVDATKPRPWILVASTWWREIGVDLINRGYEFGRDFALVQRRLTADKWTRDALDPLPVFIGRKTYGHYEFIRYYPPVRPRHIGAFTSIAVGARLLINHHQDAITTHPFITHRAHGVAPEDRLDLYTPFNPAGAIGNDVWIGANASVMPGVTIGDGAIIGANALVAHDVPPFAIAVGTPARVLRYRFDEAQIALLQAVRWWTWPDRRLRQHLEAFRRPGDFFRLAEQLVAERARRADQ